MPRHSALDPLEATRALSNSRVALSSG